MCLVEFRRGSAIEKHKKDLEANSIIVRVVIKPYSKELEFGCDICGKCYVSKSGLENHIKVHDSAYKNFKI